MYWKRSGTPLVLPKFNLAWLTTACGFEASAQLSPAQIYAREARLYCSLLRSRAWNRELIAHVDPAQVSKPTRKLAER